MMMALAAFVFFMLMRGQGMAAAGGMWALCVLYIALTGAPQPSFPSALGIMGMVAFILQLVMNLNPPPKKK